MIFANKHVNGRIPEIDLDAACTALGSLQMSLKQAVGAPDLEVHVAMVETGESIIRAHHVPPAMLESYLDTMSDLLNSLRRHVPSLCLRAEVMLRSNICAGDVDAAGLVQLAYLPMPRLSN